MNKTLVEYLQEFKKVGAGWGKDKGRTAELLFILSELLPAGEYFSLVTAKEQYINTGGREALDRESNALIQKYRHDPPDPRKRTLL